MEQALSREGISTSVLSDFYASVRLYTEDLCRPLQSEDYVPQPVAFVSPAKWHLAHTSWFFEEFVLKPNLPYYAVFHKDFSFLFNSYYNTVGQRVVRAERGNLSRPGVAEVYAYRRHVDASMAVLFASDRIAEALSDLIVLGLNHEQQHQELLITDLKYTFGHNPLLPVYKEGFSLVDRQNPKPAGGWAHLPEGVYEIGHSGEGFCWDNEKGRHKVYLQSCSLADGLVTNGDFMDFIENGGYSNHALWLDDGWAWAKSQTKKAPLYWHQIDGVWHQYTLGGLETLRPDDILCHVNFYEAWAFAQWKGLRLPTEFEWEAASALFSWGDRWEWTNSAYLPYPGYQTPAGAVGEYNGKFMINQMVLRGGSSATPAGHSRNTYRNFFQPELQWQCTGIRLAK